jgi:hypothetical protein
MKKLLGIFLICLAALPAFCQPTSGWRVATITGVRIHEIGEKVGASDAVSYDVSVKVDDTIYVVLYTPPLRDVSVKYAAGRSGLVLVGKSTIRYNDLLGESFDLPIESQKPASNPKESEPVSSRPHK